MSQDPASASSQPRWTLRHLLVPVLVLACFGAYWRWGRTGGVSAERPSLTVDPARLHFGEVWENDQFEWTIPIHNRTAEAVSIERFYSSCNCLSVKPESLVIPSGGKAEVQLTINLILSPPRSKEEVSGQDVMIQLQPHVENTSLFPPGGWVLGGRVRRAFSFDPPVVDFGTSHQGHTIAPRMVVVTAHVPLKDLRVTCPPDAAVVDVTRIGESATRFQVRIAPHSTLPPGPFRFLVALQPVGGRAEQFSLRNVPMRGHIEAEYQPIPGSLHLGLRQLGESVTETVVLHSASDRLFHVQGVDAGSDDTTVEVASQVAASGKTFTVSQRVSALGEQKRLVHFSLQTSDNLTVRVPLTITYVGVPKPQEKGVVP